MPFGSLRSFARYRFTYCRIEFSIKCMEILFGGSERPKPNTPRGSASCFSGYLRVTFQLGPPDCGRSFTRLVTRTLVLMCCAECPAMMPEIIFFKSYSIRQSGKCDWILCRSEM